MRKIINYELAYFRAGEEFKKTIPIKFISNGVHDEYVRIAQKANDTLTLDGKRKQLIEDSAWVITDRKKKFAEKRKEVKEIQKEIKQIDEDMKALDGEVWLKDRFKLIDRILTDNGIDDADLHDFNFWDKCTEAQEAWGFLAAVVMKDYKESKKKAV